MRQSCVVCSAVAGILLLGSAVGAQQQGQFILAMSDDKGQPVSSFGPADLEVFEDGKPAKVVKVEPRPSSMKVTLALDNGRPVSDILVHIKAAARQFVAALPPSVEVALMTTAPVPRFSVRSTTNRQAIDKAIDAMSPDVGPARTVEAIRDVADSWRKQTGDLVMVVLGSTYALELVTKNDIEGAVKQVTASKGVAHVVLINPSSATEGDAQLAAAERVTGMTRGRFELIGSYLQLGILAEIAKDLARSASGGQFIVTIERPEGATGKLGSLSLSPATGFQAGRITRMQQ